MKRKLLTILTVLLVAVIVYNLRWDLIERFLKEASLRSIAAAYIVYLASFWARALRWKLMLPEEGMPRLFRVVVLHTMANNIYPARTGELSFLYLLGEYPKGRLTSMLLAARVADICCIGLLFATATLIVLPQGIKGIAAGLATAAIATLLFIGAITMAKRKESKATGFVRDLLEGLSDQRNKLPAIFSVSMLVWLIKYTSFYILAKEIMSTSGYRISFWQAVFGLSFSELTTVLPLHSIGGFGTFEAGWTGAFMILGVEKTPALTSGFIFHSILLIFSTATGLPFLIRKYLKPLK